MTTKICSKCGIEKDLDAFSNNKTRKDGKQHQCRDCNKQYSDTHKEEIKLNNAKWIKEHPNYYNQYQKDNPEYRKQYRETHKEEIKQYSDTHKEEIKLNNAKWIKEHPEYRKQYCINNPEIIRKCRHNQQSKRRGWGNPQPINKSFPGSHLHHLHVYDNETGEIDHRIAINIPANLHKSVWHAHDRPELMQEINLKVMQWYYGLTIDW
ncbi:hypothetical protein GQ473_00160 [archaeon]|nr:hypothetical protein [archaeon]